MHQPAKHLELELIDMKVDMAVNQAINRVIDRLNELDNKQNARFSTLENRMSSIENRMIAVETRLGMVNENQREIRTRFIDYTFKAVWLVLSALGLSLAYTLLIHFHALS